MSQAKRASKAKRPSKAVSVLGIAGASLAASTGGSLADVPVADLPSQNTAPFQFITLAVIMQRFDGYAALDGGFA